MLPENLLASKAAGFIPSPVRDVFEISMQPGMISLAGGNPDLSLMDHTWMAEAASRAITERGSEVLQYGSGLGVTATREAAAAVMAAQGMSVDPETVQITAGSQMGLDLVTKLLTDPGDVILTEALSYTGALSLFSGSGAEAVGVEMDNEGLLPDALEATIERVRAEGKRPRFLYTIPEFNNPSGISLAGHRRERIVQICRAAGIVVLEDAPYSLLSFAPRTQDAAPSLWSLDPENVIYLGSFSKILAPGLRVGWMVAPSSLRRSVQLASEATVICPTVLAQELAAGFVARPDWLEQVNGAARVYGQRFAALDTALQAHLPAGVDYTRPEGGFFTWLTLPGGIAADAVLDAAIERKLVFVPGASFRPDGSGQDQLRLAFSWEDPEVLTEGARRLGAAVAQVLDAAGSGAAGTVAGTQGGAAK